MIKSASDVQLMAVPTRNPSEPTLLVARAGGFGNNFVQLKLEPGWRLMRRQYGKRTLGHLYVYREGVQSDEGSAAEPAAPEAAEQTP